MADVKWIKIVTDIFDDSKILLIEALLEADTLIVIWFKLLCLAGKENNDGVFVFNGNMPYTDEMLATIFRRPVNTVRFALEVFLRNGMIEIIEDTVVIPNWGKHQSIDKLEVIRERGRLRAKAFREKKALEKSNAEITLRNATDKMLDKKLEETREDKKTSRQKTKVFDVDGIECTLSKLLADKINLNDVHISYNIQNWAKHIDRMIRIDKIDPDDIKKIIIYAQSDSFWKSNILSTAKLREKYAQLKIRMQNPIKPKDNVLQKGNFEQREHDSDYFDGLYANPKGAK